MDDRARCPETRDERVVLGSTPVSPRGVSLAVPLAGEKVLLFRGDWDPEQGRRCLTVAAELGEGLLSSFRARSCGFGEHLGEGVDAALAIPIVALNLSEHTVHHVDRGDFP